jgi:Icc-related predicted phosphoesterase
MTAPTNVVRIAAMGDVHYGKTAQSSVQSVFSQLADHADVLVLCGDLTDYGLPDEARILARDLSAHVRIPVVGVLGNHDFEGGKQDEIRQILIDAGVAMLDGESHEVHGIGFAGVRGFCGGFGRGALGPWGENIIKAFVHEAVTESLKLETALARLRTQTRIAVLHYAPVRATVEGEPLEIFPFLGSSRLEEPLSRYPVRAVFHGHAHNGQLEGRTTNGTVVYNVAMPLLRKRWPDRPPFRIVQVDRQAVDEAAAPITAPEAPVYRRRATDHAGENGGAEEPRPGAEERRIVAE